MSNLWKIIRRMQIRIIKPGILATIQDLGRENLRSQGVPLAGAMDRLSARIANQALGNRSDAAVIELTLGGARLYTESDVLIAYSGEGPPLGIGDHPLPPDRPLFVPRGTEIRQKTAGEGCRIYVAVAGGWDVPPIMKSRSTYLPAAFGGLRGRSLRAGDLLQSIEIPNTVTQKLLSRLSHHGKLYPSWGIARWSLRPSVTKRIRIVPAPEFTWFDGQSLVQFLSVPFRVSSESNRMGYRLEGPPMHRIVNREMISTAVVPGTIQVTGQGSLVILMADGQTTGGYPRIGQVAAVDLSLCAQLKPGDEFFFSEISRKEAEKLYIQQETALHKLSVSWNLHSNHNNGDH